MNHPQGGNYQGNKSAAKNHSQSYANNQGQYWHTWSPGAPSSSASTAYAALLASLTCCLACGFVLGLNLLCDACANHSYQHCANPHWPRFLTPCEPKLTYYDTPCYMVGDYPYSAGVSLLSPVSLKICGPQLGGSLKCPLCCQAVTALLRSHYHQTLVGAAPKTPSRPARPPSVTNTLVGKDRFFANWNPLPRLNLSEYEYHEQQLQDFEQIALNVNDNISSIIEDYRYANSAKSFDDSPFRELHQTFAADPNHDSPILPRIRVRPNILAPTTKNLHLENWNAATSLCSVYNLGPQFRCESLTILEQVLEHLLSPHLHHPFLEWTNHPFRSPSCNDIDVNHLPIQQMLDASWAILIQENQVKIAAWIDYKVNRDPPEAPFLSNHPHHTNLTHAQLMEAIIVMNHGDNWPALTEVATNFAFYLAGADVCYDIFACSQPWTAAILQKAAPPGAWLADALHTVMIAFWLPGWEQKQDWAGNQYYAILYDQVNEALLHHGRITDKNFAANERRSSNNKGNSMELLAFHLWDQGEHVLLFTMILTIIALNARTREWAPVGFPDFA